MLWMCIWMSLYHVNARIAEQAFGSCLELCLWVPPEEQKRHIALVKAIYPSKMAPASLSNTYEVYHKLRMRWMCIWMSLYHVTAIIAEQAFGSCLELWVWCKPGWVKNS